MIGPQRSRCAILGILTRPTALKAKCDALIEAAFSCGAPDNVTALLVEWKAEKERARSKAA